MTREDDIASGKDLEDYAREVDEMFPGFRQRFHDALDKIDNDPELAALREQAWNEWQERSK